MRESLQNRLSKFLDIALSDPKWAQSNWMDIKTAPNNRKIDMWVYEPYSRISYRIANEYLYVGNSENLYGQNLIATHWMEVPEGPEVDQNLIDAIKEQQID